MEKSLDAKGRWRNRNVGCCRAEENLNTEVRELEADNHNSMDMDTRSALGSLFDDED